MTPAEELLIALKKHATTIRFEFIPARLTVHICGLFTPQVNVTMSDGIWYEDVFGNPPDLGLHKHSSAESAIKSAFARSR